MNSVYVTFNLLDWKANKSFDNFSNILIPSHTNNECEIAADHEYGVAKWLNF